MIVADQKNLYNAVKLCKEVLVKPSTMKSIRISNNEEGILEFRSTDNELFLKAKIPVVQHGSRIESVLLNSSALEAVLKPTNGSKDPVNAETNGDKVEFLVEGTKTNLKKADGFDVYPEFPVVSDYRLLLKIDPYDGFREGMKFVQQAISLDRTRPHLQSVLFDKDNLVSTDGHRLHLLKTNLNVEKNFLVMDRMWDLLIKILSQGNFVVSIYRSKNSLIKIEAGPYTMEMQDPGVDFPDYDQVIPKENHNYTTTVETKTLRKAVNRVFSLAKNKTNKQAKLTRGKELKFEVSDFDLGTSETIVSSYEGFPSGEKESFAGVNMKYLSEALAHADDSFVKIQIEDDLGPIRIDMESTRMMAIVMPVRL